MRITPKNMKRVYELNVGMRKIELNITFLYINKENEWKINQK